ncbi:MFS transporter [Histoplasma capsulatum H143]|uniref:MFS transporter n=1 Tax=Ajellomyces capsulatus (strain H143) TaxID=544712 RepID=C6H7Z6_AJECH|nr:MFS transporter [Histoplasma capsulatum H143]
MPFVILGHSPVESSKIELRVPMSQHVDAPIAVTGHQRTRLTEEDHVRIKRKTDMAILPVLVWIYFLQVSWIPLPRDFEFSTRRFWAQGRSSISGKTPVCMETNTRGSARFRPSHSWHGSPFPHG